MQKLTYNDPEGLPGTRVRQAERTGQMLFQKKKQEIKRLEYDRANEKPVLKCSICNGEQVAGFKNIRTGKFHEVMFVRNDQDLQTFKQTYGLSEVAKEY